MYGGAWEKIANARVQHDDTVVRNFLFPWQQTLQAQINVAVKARQAVRVSRLELDAAKQAYVALYIFRFSCLTGPFILPLLFQFEECQSF